MIKKLCYAAACCWWLTNAGATHALTITDLGPSPSRPDENAYQIDFSPITFVVTQDSPETFGFLVKDYFLSDASQTGLNISGDFIVSVNGSTSVYNGTEASRGPLGSDGDIFTERDLHIGIGAGSELFPVSVGDVVEIRARDLRFQSPPPLPPEAPGPFEAFMIGSGPVGQVSGVVQIARAVEPSPRSPKPVPIGGLWLLLTTAGLLLVSGLRGAALRERFRNTPS